MIQGMYQLPYIHDIQREQELPTPTPAMKQSSLKKQPSKAPPQGDTIVEPPSG